VNENFLDGTGVTKMSLYELNRYTLVYIDHWIAELSDFTNAWLKKMIYEGNTLFYIAYTTSITAPYTGNPSGGIMKLNHTYHV